ncbi:MAG TPA: hypothetical protein DIV79_10965 [Opitutae bacterium]|nr:hypothetical protein [Myxococcales bacterium]HCR30526.1 hypothetical protein [Opitutae bacterium]
MTRLALSPFAILTSLIFATFLFATIGCAPKSEDGPWTYSLPAFGSGQGRIWDPQRPPQGGALPGRDGTGNYHDRFGKKLTLDAKADGIVGYGTILFDNETREITLEIHPMVELLQLFKGSQTGWQESPEFRHDR